MLIGTTYTISSTSDDETYIVTFNETGHTAQLQTETLDSVLHADHGELVLVRYTEYDDCLLESEDEKMDFIINNLPPEVLIKEAA